jgi:predicted RNA binding protein YcfA (HicA-like mRNA interferase family)
MKNDSISFATLQRVLEGLGFVKGTVPGSHLYFEHPPSGTVFLFRLYKPEDKLSSWDRVGVRKLLIERGVVDEDTLDELLHQPSP